MFNTLFGGLGSMLFYGTSDFFAKTVIDKIGNLKSLVYVQFIGAFVYLIYFIFNPALPDFSTKNIALFLLLATIYTLGYIFLYRAFEQGKMGIVSPVASIYTPMVAVLAYFFLNEAFPAEKVLILFLIMLGVFLTSFNYSDVKSGLLSKGLTKGIPSAVISSLFFAVFFPIFSRFMDEDGWVVWSILIRLFLVVAISFFLVLGKKEKLSIHISNSLKFKLVLASVLEGAAFFTLSFAFNRLDTNTSVVTAIQSGYALVTGILAFIFLKERLSWNQYFGSLLIVGGIIGFTLI